MCVHEEEVAQRPVPKEGAAPNYLARGAMLHLHQRGHGPTRLNVDVPQDAVQLTGSP